MFDAINALAASETLHLIPFSFHLTAVN